MATDESCGDIRSLLDEHVKKLKHLIDVKEQHHDDIRSLLDEHVKSLKDLIGVEEEPRGGIRSELDEHAKRLKDLIGVKDMASEDDSADYLMCSVAEDCEKKRLFICCDGTRNNASGTVDPLTNVAKFARAIYRTGNDEFKVPTKKAVMQFTHANSEEKRFGNVRQLVYYSSGVGTRSALGTDSLYASAVGKGLSANILDAYCFICNNYNYRSLLDEIILVGFSRGAFTVRCLSQFINDVGLIRRSGLVFLPTVFRLWRDNAGYNPGEDLAKDQWTETYRKLRRTLKALREFIPRPRGNTPIKVLAEWDTVSAVGIWESRLSFIGATVPKNVQNAFHAVSIHEKRKKFQPMMWKSADNNATNIKQCLFAGCHSDVGGGNPDPALSTVSLFWMIGNIKNCCEAKFDHEWTTLQHVTPVRKDRSWWSSQNSSLCLSFPSFAGFKRCWLLWKHPTLHLQIQSFAQGLYAIPYWILGRFWDGKRDSYWEEFLKQEDQGEDGQRSDGRVGDDQVGDGINDGEDEVKPPAVNLTIHTTVRLLYKYRYEENGAQKSDPGLRCGLFENFEPSETDKTWRWVKRGTTPKIYFEEEPMTDVEKEHFSQLLDQAEAVHKLNPGECWTASDPLRDDKDGCDWNDVSKKLGWGGIMKGCSYDQTFISLLKSDLKEESDEAESNGDQGSDLN
ncbi:hypothetical protein PGQ11_011929 [Apiospora arundinis]|uniref:T6SS Phospholipase effector Tle1-like catalytic domain-containing protein n=1 Tax=Apiospora arundinis TaxID=335852 RepID=A0ABR2I1G4_9PEZI